MKITVINGSPKGKYSITLQTVLYLEKVFKEHEFEVLHAGQMIRSLEKDFQKAKDLLEEADLILFSYPVYTFLVPSQLHRFVELMKENNVNLEGKFVTQLTTSKHFYDVTAHRFIQDNCQDMKMKYIHGLSADMDDLLTKDGQRQAREFLKYVQWCMENCENSDNQLMQETVKKRSGDVVIVTDCAEDNEKLQSMIQHFRAVLSQKSRVFNLRKFPFGGGCIGCFNCAVSGKCIYKDKFDALLRNKIQCADAIVFAFTIKDHSMGSRFKMYDDRQFCNGHRTVTMGMPMGYLIDGNYSKEPNLQMVIEGRAEVGQNFLAGVATNEGDFEQSARILAKTIDYALQNSYVPPQNFYGVGGMKIFRDLIYQMQGMMRADHAFYRKHHQYDFPQKKKGTILKMYAVGALLSSPKIKAKMGNKMNEGMIMPYQKVIDHAGEERGV